MFGSPKRIRNMDIGLTWGLGVAVSLIVQLVKKYAKISTLATYIALIAVSLVGATVYYFLVPTSIWPVLVNILAVAAGFHNLLLRRFE